MSDPEKAFTPEFIAEKRGKPNRLDRLTTVVFDNEEQYAKFLTYAYREFKGTEGLEFTDSALPMSVRVGPDLLEATHERFSMRLPASGEEQRYLDSLPGDRPFHPDTFRDRKIPGADYFKRAER